MKIVNGLLLSNFIIKFRLYEAIRNYEFQKNNNNNFDFSSILGFRTKDKHFIIDYILINKGLDISGL